MWGAERAPFGHSIITRTSFAAIDFLLEINPVACVMQCHLYDVLHVSYLLCKREN